MTSTGSMLPVSGSRMADTAPPGRVRVPFGATSYSFANSTAWPGPARDATRRSALGAPVMVSDESTGSLVKIADWPGRSAVSAAPAPVDPSVDNTEPRPGTVEMADGDAPGGRMIVPSSEAGVKVTVFVCVGSEFGVRHG